MSPVCTSHSRTVSSRDPDATSCSSDEKTAVEDIDSVIQLFSYSVIQCPRAARRTPRFDASMAAASQPLPTTPPRMLTIPLSAPPVRQSNRTRTLSARGRAMAEEEGETVVV